MLLESLLGYKSSWRILSLLLETPRKLVSRKEIFQLTKLGNAPLSRGLDRLQKTGIIILEKRGNREFYYLNEKNEYLQQICELWKKEQKSLRNLPYGINTVLSEFLRGIQDSCISASQILLFGSHAKGTASVNSDIDVAIISEKTGEEIKISRIVRKIEQQFSMKVQVHFFTSKGFSEKNALVQEIKRDGIDLLR
ncbi:nucleotidyltransferase domain-containing protein [Candidatus Woesearchaeota archaeon]|nr:nucleotidyltransferase domain-containing protein [Candidatus Woesearchaeota archaeon]